MNGAWRAILAYAAHDDPLVAAGNMVALVIASNQPFYPVYLHYVVGNGVASSFFTFLSTPFFLAVPAVARRHALAGRMLLVLAGIANTVSCAKLFGVASGVELFLGPCIMLATLMFRRHERLAMLGLTGLALVVYRGLHDRYGAPFQSYTAAEYADFLSLNAFSVATLTAFIGISFSNALGEIESGKR